MLRAQAAMLRAQAAMLSAQATTPCAQAAMLRAQATTPCAQAATPCPQAASPCIRWSPRASPSSRASPLSMRCTSSTRMQGGTVKVPRPAAAHMHAPTHRRRSPAACLLKLPPGPEEERPRSWDAAERLEGGPQCPPPRSQMSLTLTVSGPCRPGRCGGMISRWPSAICPTTRSRRTGPEQLHLFLSDPCAAEKCEASQWLGL